MKACAQTWASTSRQANGSAAAAASGPESRAAARWILDGQPSRRGSGKQLQSSLLLTRAEVSQPSWWRPGGGFASHRRGLLRGRGD